MAKPSGLSMRTGHSGEVLRRRERAKTTTLRDRAATPVSNATRAAECRRFGFGQRKQWKSDRSSRFAELSG